MMKNQIKNKINELIENPNSTENIEEYIRSLNLTSNEITEILIEVIDHIRYKDMIETYYLVQEESRNLNLTEEEFLENRIS